MEVERVVFGESQNCLHAAITLHRIQRGAFPPRLDLDISSKEQDTKFGKAKAQKTSRKIQPRGPVLNNHIHTQTALRQINPQHDKRETNIPQNAEISNYY